MIGLYQVFVLAAQAYPTKRTISIIKQLRPHNIFHIAGPDKTVLFVRTIPGNFPDTGIINGFHKRISIIEEISATRHEFLYNFKMTAQGLVHQKTKFFGRFMQHPGAFLKCQSGRTITSFVNSMAGGLIREQFNRYIFFFRIFQQINHITMISDRTRLSTLHRLIYDTERFNYTIGNMPYPSLFVTGFDTRSIHFGNDTGGSGNFRRFGLCPAHSSQAGRGKQMSAQIFILRNTEFHPSGIQ